MKTENSPQTKLLICRIIEVENNNVKLLQNLQLPFTKENKEIMIKWLKHQKGDMSEINSPSTKLGIYCSGNVGI